MMCKKNEPRQDKTSDSILSSLFSLSKWCGKYFYASLSCTTDDEMKIEHSLSTRFVCGLKKLIFCVYIGMCKTIGWCHFLGWFKSFTHFLRRKKSKREKRWLQIKTINEKMTCISMTLNWCVNFIQINVRIDFT